MWNKQQLEQQRDEIISEFDYCELIEVLDYLNDIRPAKAYKYYTVAECRKSLLKALDYFIEKYLSENGECYKLALNNWHIELSYEYDGETPLMQAHYYYQIAYEVAAYNFCSEFKKDSNVTK